MHVTCEHCQSKLNAPPETAGKRVKCPRCQGSISIPEAPTKEPEPVFEEMTLADQILSMKRPGPGKDHYPNFNYVLFLVCGLFCLLIWGFQVMESLSMPSRPEHGSPIGWLIAALICVVLTRFERLLRIARRMDESD